MGRAVTSGKTCLILAVALAVPVVGGSHLAGFVQSRQ